MNTKRVNNEFHRLDVKLPIDVYTKISEIAVNSFDARVHHISGKPEITPTLIYLLEMGIQSFLNGSELIKKYDTDKLTDNIPITDKWVKELIKDELTPIQSKLDELSEMVYRLTYTDKNTDNELIGVENIAVAITERILEDITDNDTDTITDKVEIDTDNHTDNDTDKSREKVIDVDIPSLIEKYGFKEGAIEDKANFSLLVGEVLGRKVREVDLSRVAKGEKGFIAPPEFWLYITANKNGTKWIWTLKPTP